MSNASDRVFGTQKILEMILLGVPQQDLLTSVQRVCRQWRLHLYTSRLLLGAIGFAPDDDGNDGNRMSPRGDLAFSPLLVDRFPKFLVHDMPGMARQESMSGDPERARRHDKACSEALAAGASAGGSWLFMQVAHPPVRKIAIVDHMCTFTWPKSKGLRFRGVCDFPDGMLMGELFFSGMQRVGTQPPPPQDSESHPPAEATAETARHPGQPVGFSLSCKKADIRDAFLYCDNGAGESSWCWEKRDAAGVEMADAAAALYAQTDAVLQFWMGCVDDTHWADADWHYFSRMSGLQYP